MESTGIPSRVQITNSVVDSLEPGSFVCESRGKIQVKGKGLIDTFILDERVQPRDKYLVQNIEVPDDLELVEVFHKPRRNNRRRSTHNLQDALMALQTQLEAFNGSFPRMDGMTQGSRRGSMQSYMSASIGPIGESDDEQRG